MAHRPQRQQDAEEAQRGAPISRMWLTQETNRQVKKLMTFRRLKQMSGIVGHDMLGTEWSQLELISERIGQLNQRAHAAGAAGDVEMAAYFRRQAGQATEDRRRTVDRLFGEICEAA
jgi:hypothetical protein